MRIGRAGSLSGNKIKTLKGLQKIIRRLKAKGKKIVFTNGCFDILHWGHVQYLEKAKAKGDVLVIAVNSDASVKKIKGKNRPIINQEDRIRTLAGLESVDYLVLFNQNTPLKTIQALKPDVLIKGADWPKNKITGADFISAYGGKVSTITLAPGRSTSGLIEKITGKFAKK